MKRSPKNKTVTKNNLTVNKASKKSAKKKWPILLAIVVGFILALVIASAIYVSSITSGLTVVKVDDSDFGITTAETVEAGQESQSEIETEKNLNANVINVVFLGIDREENRSDSMMVLSVNPDTNTLKVISLLRDSKVTIEGCIFGTKLGYAYKWGGSAFAVKTINQNFNTSFNQYVTMNFENVIEIVDALGYVEIELTQEEADIVNSSSHTFGYYEDDAVEGVNQLNGIQALAYSRIRSIDGEYYRASRQQTVLKAMLERAKEIPKTDYPDFIKLILNSMETTLTFDDIWKLATTLNLSTLDIQRYTIPDEDYEEDLWGGWETVENWEPLETCYIDESQWVWIYDLDAASKRLKNIIYEN